MSISLFHCIIATVIPTSIPAEPFSVTVTFYREPCREKPGCASASCLSRQRKLSSKQETPSLSVFRPPSLFLARLTFPRIPTVIPSPPFRIESSRMAGRYALRGSGRKAAESSLALEGAFNWIRLIRLNSPSLAHARARAGRSDLPI